MIFNFDFVNHIIFLVRMSHYSFLVDFSFFHGFSSGPDIHTYIHTYIHTFTFYWKDYATEIDVYKTHFPTLVEIGENTTRVIYLNLQICF